MSESKKRDGAARFTPGELTLYEIGPGAFEIQGPQDERVATVEDEAYAHLFASSPALYAALEDALEMIRLLRGLAWTGSRIDPKKYPEWRRANASDARAVSVLREARGEE